MSEPGRPTPNPYRDLNKPFTMSADPSPMTKVSEILGGSQEGRG